MVGGSAAGHRQGRALTTPPPQEAAAALSRAREGLEQHCESARTRARAQQASQWRPSAARCGARRPCRPPPARRPCAGPCAASHAAGAVDGVLQGIAALLGIVEAARGGCTTAVTWANWAHLAAAGLGRDSGTGIGGVGALGARRTGWDEGGGIRDTMGGEWEQQASRERAEVGVPAGTGKAEARALRRPTARQGWAYPQLLATLLPPERAGGRG